MSKKEKIVIIVIILLLSIPIIINEIKIRPKLNLINDVKKILKNIDDYKQEKDSPTKEYIIDNGYTIDNKNYKVDGSGVIFVDNDSSVFLNRDGMCAMKVPYSEEIMIQYEKCPVYRVFNNIKTPLTNDGSGLYKEEDGYIYKGDNLDNFIIYNDDLWNIVSFEDGNMKIIKYLSDSIAYENIEELYSVLITKYSEIFSDERILSQSWDIENIILSDKKIETAKKITSKIGILSTKDYLSTIVGSYKYKMGSINVNGKSYLNRDMVLSANNAYLSKNNNVTISLEKGTNKIYPVIVLSNKAIVESGSGTKNDPYMLKETK